jgi:TRAP-type C4-dicarboxylate transport system substrate-binding protein
MDHTARLKAFTVLLVAMLAVACGGTQGSAPAAPAPADKAGALPGPVTLRLGTESDPGRPTADQIREFVHQVEELSSGQLVIEPAWDANGPDDGSAGGDQVVARMVVAGDLEMGMIPSRAWDTEGVTTLRALQAPFLITSDELSAAVAMSSDLAPELLGGLDDIGVTGLALVPESLRHLLFYGEVPSSVADFAGLTIRAPRSNTTFAIVEALGAKADDFTDPGESELTADAAEAAFALGGTLPKSNSALGNVPLFPKVNTLVINTVAFRRLTEEQRDILRHAAANTAETVSRTTPDTLEYAEIYCRNGGTIVLADETFLRALRNATEPVSKELARDATTASLMQRIEALGREIHSSPPAVRPCSEMAQDPSAGPVDPSPATAEPGDTFPQGIYRKEVTAQELIGAGVDGPTASENEGTWTLTFVPGKSVMGDCPGSTYAVANRRVTITLGTGAEGCGTDAGHDLFSAAWSLNGDQLQLTDLRNGNGEYSLVTASVFGGRPFTKID